MYLQIFLFCVCHINIASSEWFSSLSHMEDLIHDELDLLSSLQSYIHAEELRIQEMKTFADQYKQTIGDVKVDMDKYLGHPISQYKLIARFAVGWPKVEKMVSENKADEFISNLTKKKSSLPNMEDVKGSAQAIMRLQDTYMLDTHDIAQGTIKGNQANQTLTPDDCFHIGRTAYLEKDYYHCALWMTEVFGINEQEYKTFSRFDVLDHLAYCLGQEGKENEAYLATTELLNIKPENKRIQKNLEIYRAAIQNRTDQDNGPTSLTRNKQPFFIKYERLCRNGNTEIPPKIEKRLKCYSWTNNNHPRLILQPVKLEEMWDSPHLVRFYDVVSDHEINVIKSIAKPLLRRATVYNPKSGALEHARYRVSKSSWLKDDDHDVIFRVGQRISDITGLSLETAETLQVANYGVGGQYEPHYDYIRKAENVDPEEGNRIATFLIYLSDVDYGGNTVFLNPGVAVKPVKGSAAFWYNLFPSGLPDDRTRHAACPVLTGVKWVANKWIHERGQEMLRSCKAQEEADNRVF